MPKYLTCGADLPKSFDALTPLALQSLRTEHLR